MGVHLVALKRSPKYLCAAEKENGVANDMKIKILRSDNRGEYKSVSFLQLGRDEVNERHFTVRETSQ